MRSLFFLLALAGAVLLSGCASPDSSPESSTDSDADYILQNATIYTANPNRPTAEALAVSGNDIVAVGSNADLRDAFPEAPRVDASGHTVVPGLIDSHAHLMGLGTSLIQANLVGAPSKQATLDSLAAFAETLPEGVWLRGRGWDQNDWPVKEFPTRHDLDALFPERPVLLGRVDGHAAWVNTAAINATVGLDSLQAMADPEGGAILRDASGVPTGVLIDAAEGVVRADVPPLPDSELDRALAAALERTARYGLTGVHDAGIDLATIGRYRRFIEEDRFPLRLYGMIGGRGETFDTLCENGTVDHVSGRLTVRSVKFYMDGALGSRGAALLSGYSDAPDNRGLLMKQPAPFEQDVRDAFACGFQVNTHAIGTRANRVVLDAYEVAMEDASNSPGRHRVEHAQILHPDDLPRFAELDVIPAMQPTHATSDMYWADDRLGDDRLDGAYAWKSLQESGARLAFGSDFPVEQVNPLLGFYAAITRQDADGWPEGGWRPEERVSRETALRGFTQNAAYAGFHEDTLGSLTEGKRADFVILSDDIMQIPPMQILDTHVVATYLDGAPIYATDDAPAMP